MAQTKDDMVVHGKGKQHNNRLERVLKRSRGYDITFRTEKCKFGQSDVTWFGNVYSKQGMSPDPEKVDVIKR